MQAAGIRSTESVHADAVLAQVEELIGKIAPLTKSDDVLPQAVEFLSRIDGVRRAGALRNDAPTQVWVKAFGQPVELEHLPESFRIPPHYSADSGAQLRFRFESPPVAPEGVDSAGWDDALAERRDDGDIDVICMPLVGTVEPIGAFWIIGGNPEGLNPELIEALNVLGSVVAMTLEKIDSVDEAADQLAEMSSLHHKLEVSNRDFQSFAQMASSDLQDPLRKIITYGDRLERSGIAKLSERELDYLARIHSASDRMQRLINDLLTFSSVHTNDAQHEPTDLELIVVDVLSDLEVAIADANAVIKIGELPTIIGNSTQLRQLFQNLIGNAIKFRAPDVAPRIEVSWSNTTDSYRIITVSDNGIGFDAKFHDKIFRPFQRLHGASDYSGSGIGLSVCKRIVSRHNGWLTAKSAPGDGATFLLYFPTVATPSSAAPSSVDAVAGDEETA